MTVQECYESMGSDFEGVLGRMGSEAMVKRFALKFLDDPSYGNLVKAVEEQNAEEKLRGREFDGYEEAYGEAQKEYRNTIDAIRTMTE